MLWIWCFFTSLCLIVAAPPSRDVTSTAMYNTITTNGYAAETHQVTTEDGYVLGVFRMPYARYQTSADEDRPVVFLQHGLYGESLNYILARPEIGFGFNLADAGFDVWFGNARGNVHSRAHENLDPDADSAEFFDFSWDDIGMYDIPAMIDYILNHTGKEKLHYIGHSQGGTVFLVMASMRTEYNEKMASVHLLAPAGYQDHFPNPELKQLAQFTNVIYSLALAMGFSELSMASLEQILNNDENATQELTRSDLCFGDIKYKNLCDLVGAKYYMRNFRDTEDETSLDGFGGGALKQIAHYGQNIRDLQFRRFDHGNIQNLVLYGTTTAPAYNLGLITSNVVMHYSLNDDIVDGEDVLAMTADMPNAVARKVARDSFDHSDYVIAEDAKELVTDFIIESILNVHNGVSEGENEAENEAEDTLEEETSPIVPEAAADDAAHSSLNLIIKLYFLFCIIYVLV